MQFDILTIFPDYVNSLFAESILGRALDQNLIKVNVHDLRKWTTDNHQSVDNKPFGGGPGMVMMVEPIYNALKDLGLYPTRPEKTKVILTSAGGQTWSQQTAQQYAAELARIVIICGHYEGVDQRVADHLVDAEISIGNYVLTGGELAAGVIADSVSRLLPGVLGNPESLAEESHQSGTDKEYPHYTRPAAFATAEGESWDVPDTLMSGNHADIAKWRQEHSV